MNRSIAVAVSAAILAGPAMAETLTMSSWVPPTHFVHTDILAPYAEAVSQATEGRVTVTILPAPLGAPQQHWELARTAVADITWGNFTYEPERFVPMWFAEFPGAGTDATAQSVALWCTFDEEMRDLPAFDGVEVLGVGMFGGGQMHHGKETIATPEQLAGQKFRMGGPIQERLLTELGAVPVAAPASKAYELLESGVIDGSLHTMESVVNFRLEDSLTHHTVFPGGLYDATFFIAMNGARWAGLSEADRAAIRKISGEALSRAWGEAFDVQNPAAREALAEAGHEVVDASPELIAAVDEVKAGMVDDWVEAARAAGIEDPEALIRGYQSRYAEIIAE